MGLENFTLDMSQEACHMFAGMVMGWGFVIKILVAVAILKVAGKFLEDTGEYAWEKVKSKFKGEK